MNKKILFILALMFWAIVGWAQIDDQTTRKQLPPIIERMQTQPIHQEILNPNSGAMTEQMALMIKDQNGEPQAHFSINAFRLINKKADRFDGYRSMPWWLRNVILEAKYPTNKFDGQNFSFQLKWGFFIKSHRWDEYWDNRFIVNYPEHAELMTDEWLADQQQKLFKASALVNQLLLTEGLNGYSLTVGSRKKDGKWQQHSAGFIVNRYTSGFIFTAGGIGVYLPELKKAGLEISGQLYKVFWPNRWENGGIDFSLYFSSGAVIYNNNELTADDWNIATSIALPILKQSRLVLAPFVGKDGGKFITGFSYQFFAKDKK